MSTVNNNNNQENMPPRRFFPLVPEISHEKTERLTEEIEKMFEEKRQPLDSFYAKIDKVQEFEEFLLKHGLKEKAAKFGGVFRRVIPFGSSVTDMAAKSCDLDLCIVIEKPAETVGCYEDVPLKMLKWVLEVLNENTFFQGRHVKEELINATVPIIRVTEGELDADISVYYGEDPPSKMKSVQMINAYSQLDKRFAKLFIFVRQWFKNFFVGKVAVDIHRTIPNSYTTVLLVINFLQYYDILPNLFRTHSYLVDPKRATWNGLMEWVIKDYPIENDDRILRKKRDNEDKSLGQLFVAFVEHYGNIISLNKNIISVRNASTVTKSRESNKLLVWDPYDLNNPGRRTTCAHGLNLMLQRALEVLKNCENADDLVPKLWEMELVTEEMRWPDEQRVKRVKPRVKHVCGEPPVFVPSPIEEWETPPIDESLYVSVSVSEEEEKRIKRKMRRERRDNKVFAKEFLETPPIEGGVVASQAEEDEEKEKSTRRWTRREMIDRRIAQRIAEMKV